MFTSLLLTSWSHWNKSLLVFEPSSFRPKGRCLNLYARMAVKHPIYLWQFFNSFRLSWNQPQNHCKPSKSRTSIPKVLRSSNKSWNSPFTYNICANFVYLDIIKNKPLNFLSILWTRTPRRTYIPLLSYC